MYVYKDGIKAVGVIRSGQTEDTGLANQPRPGRAVTPRVGQSVVLMNGHGRLAVVDIIKVQREDTSGHEYAAPFVDFRWRVIESSWASLRVGAENAENSRAGAADHSFSSHRTRTRGPRRDSNGRWTGVLPACVAARRQLENLNSSGATSSIAAFRD